MDRKSSKAEKPAVLRLLSAKIVGDDRATVLAREATAIEASTPKE